MAPSMLSVFTAGALALSSGVAAAGSCSSYTVDTTEKTYAFNNYKFMDFRNQADKLDSYLTSDDFTQDWRISTWTKQKPEDGKYGFVNTKANVKMAANDAAPGQSMLSLFVNKNSDSDITAGEVETTLSDLYYASVRMGVRVTGDSGACAGLFYYQSDSQETDIEILTMEQTDGHIDADTNKASPASVSKLHFTNQPGREGTTVAVDLAAQNTTSTPVGNSKLVAKTSWQEWNNYRIDWTPGKTYWWSNSEMSRSMTKNTITSPSAWLMNIWSTGNSWSGVMADGTQARMDVAWVEIAYNKQSEGAPKVATKGQDGSCALGLGDGTSLTDPSAKAGPAAASGGGFASNPTTTTETAPSATPATISTGDATDATNTATVALQTDTPAPKGTISMQVVDADGNIATVQVQAPAGYKFVGSA